MIAIIDYGMGNIHSVQKAVESMGERVIVTNDPGQVSSSDKAILPGVGAFDDAMEELKKRGLAEELAGYVKKGKLLLGICLGMQLLLESSEEAKRSGGLGFLKGEVKKFDAKSGLKVPHMGWNQLKINNPTCPLLKGVDEGSYVYFCHSYYPNPQDKEVAATTTGYGIDFTSIFWKDNIYGTQFHPEKSQEAGLKILKNFVDI
ncbi:MAG: imidazole glycerol phosphate synthase subunit HisH [Candidatus Omnitrophota bacterium]|jgi:glutamine amidotransferase